MAANAKNGEILTISSDLTQFHNLLPICVLHDSVYQRYNSVEPIANIHAHACKF